MKKTEIETKLREKNQHWKTRKKTKTDLKNKISQKFNKSEEKED